MKVLFPFDTSWKVIEDIFMELLSTTSSNTRIRAVSLRSKFTTRRCGEVASRTKLQARNADSVPIEVTAFPLVSSKRELGKLRKDELIFVAKISSLLRLLISFEDKCIERETKYNLDRFRTCVNDTMDIASESAFCTVMAWIYTEFR